MEGPGRMIYSNLDVYEGTWKENVAEGFGTSINAFGVVFKGTFWNDQPNGSGIEYWPDGSVYWGEYLEGHKCG